MDKVIGCIYKYDQRNWPYPPPNTIFFIPPHFDTSIQNQRNSAYDASVVAKDVAPDRLYQRTNHRGNMNGKDNDDSQSYETHQKNNFCSSSFGDTIATTTTPRPSTLPPSGK